jgi:hypothetical protein
MNTLRRRGAIATKALTLFLSAIWVFSTFSADAAVYFGPHVRIGVGFGYYPPYPWFDPWLYPYPYGYAPYPPQPPVKQVEKPATNLFVYPEDGQSDGQTAQDRKECNDWAVEQSGLDPATATKRAKTQHLDEYNRAFGACMEGRNYTVK